MNNYKFLKYSYLNKMVYSTIINKEIWFLESLVNSNIFIDSTCDEDKYYMFYLSILFYSISKTDPIFPQDFIEKIKNIILYTYYDKKNPPRFNRIRNLKIFFNNIDELYIISLLNELFYFKNSNNFGCLIELNKSKDSLDSINNKFNDEMIIKCFLELIIILKVDIKELIKKYLPKLNNLNEDQKQILSNYSQENKLDNIKETLYFSEYFYLISQNKESLLKNNENKSNEIKLRNISNNDLMNLIKSKIQNLNNGKLPFVFNDKLSRIDHSLLVICEEIIINNLTNAAIISKLEDKFESFFENAIRKKIKEEKINIQYYDNFKKILNESDLSLYYKNFNFTLIFKDENERNKIDNIEYINFIQKSRLIWKKDAVKIIYNVDFNNSIIGNLNNKEINDIIENSFRNFNGFYNYKSKDGINNFLSRDQLYNEIKRDFLKISIKLIYKIEINEKDIYKIKD